MGVSEFKKDPTVTHEQILLKGNINPFVFWREDLQTGRPLIQNRQVSKVCGPMSKDQLII
jgi:hypothetical protein